MFLNDQYLERYSGKRTAMRPRRPEFIPKPNQIITLTDTKKPKDIHLKVQAFMPNL